jgi:Arc/MetJ-type ribon-helix-helix transcriptional regulator
MKRTTVSLPEDLAEFLEQEARSRGQSVSHVVRTSLYRTLGLNTKRDIPWAGICDDPKLPAGADLEKALTETWLEDLDRHRR